MINERLKSIRQAIGVSQQEFSNALGLEQGSYSGVESGRKGSVTKQTSMLLELVYNVNMDFLYNGKGEMFKSDASLADCTKENTAIDKEQDYSTIYERMIEKKDRRIEELALMVGNLQKEVEILTQDKKTAQEEGDALNAAERPRLTGTDDR